MVDFSTIKGIAIPEGNVKSISSNGTILWKLDEGGLPSEYQQVEYIQSNGNQYIDTGISGNANGEYEIGFNPLGTIAHSYEQYFAGTRNTGTTYVGKLFYNSSLVVYQGYPAGGDLTLRPSFADEKIDLKVLKSEGIVVNNEVKSNYGNASWGNSTFWIFNAHQESSLGASMKLYYLKMYSDGDLVRDYIPCYRKSDSVIGLYDLVSNTFFTNQGSGSFTKGGDI